MLLKTTLHKFPIIENFGQLTLSADQTFDLLKIKWQYTHPLTAILPDVLKKTFLIPVTGKDSIEITSQCPERKLIIRLYHDITIPAKGKVTFFITIPLDISLTINNQEILSLSSEVLSKTWFGDMDDGEVSYVLKKHFLYKPHITTPNHYALCAVTIINANDTELTFSRFLITPQQLALYKNGDQLWTDSLDITFKGELTPANVKIKPIPKQYKSESCELFSKPQKALPNLFQYTFERVKTMSQI
jgi:hypothetical protein